MFSSRILNISYIHCHLNEIRIQPFVFCQQARRESANTQDLGDLLCELVISSPPNKTLVDLKYIFFMIKQNRVTCVCTVHVYVYP